MISISFKGILLSIEILSLVTLLSCESISYSTSKPQNSCINDNQPYCRYWWFASEIKKEDIQWNLNWLKLNGFGGVEIAWVYPLGAYNKNDTAYFQRQKWLSPEWQDIVRYTIEYCDSIGLGVDITFGSLWPFGDSYVKREEATMRFDDTNWRQTITRSWEYPTTVYVVDHLNRNHYLPYFQRMISNIPRPVTNRQQSYFIDSWEVETKYLWTNGLEKEFFDVFGYDILPWMDSLYEKGFERFQYDYMKIISQRTLQFYKDYDSTLNKIGILSRGQCSGAPCDILTAYSIMDIPEGESMLYEPEYNSIPSSAAALSSKPIVSSETFTCLYGWPGDYKRKEQVSDLKLVADALFANGVNSIVWHGKPHNPNQSDSVSFYASVHVGSEGSLAPYLPDFNRYLQNVSSIMQQGKTFSQVAVYLPTEDAWMAGEMPLDKQFIWAWGWYEMRYVYFPEELDGYCPLWINNTFLEKASVKDGKLQVGDVLFSSLYIDVKFIEYQALKNIFSLAKKGVNIYIKSQPVEPGVIIHKDFNLLLDSLLLQPTVIQDFIPKEKPFVEGLNLPHFWARKKDNEFFLFFSNPHSENLKFPLQYGQSFQKDTMHIPVTFNYNGSRIEYELVFEPYQSLLLHIKDGRVEELNIQTHFPEPIVGEPRDFSNAKWLVH